MAPRWVRIPWLCTLAITSMPRLSSKMEVQTSPRQAHPSRVAAQKDDCDRLRPNVGGLQAHSTRVAAICMLHNAVRAVTTAATIAAAGVPQKAIPLWPVVADLGVTSMRWIGIPQPESRLYRAPVGAKARMIAGHISSRTTFGQRDANFV
jgi:hypothetical protein